MKDFYSDSGHLFASIFLHQDLPDFVRDSVANPKVASMHDDGFADPLNHLFPVNTASDTYISAAYYAKQGGGDEMVLKKIAQAAEIFGIQQDVINIQKYAGSLETKVAAAEEISRTPFKLELGIPGYPVIEGSGRSAIEKTAAIIERNQSEIPVRNMLAAAGELVKVAGMDKVALPDLFQKLAGKTVATESAVREQKTIRLGAINDPIKKKEAATRLESVADAATLSDFDKEFKIAGLYGKSLLDPISTFHPMPVKPGPATLREKIAQDLSVNGSTGIAFGAIAAASSDENAKRIMKEGVQSIDDTFLALTTTYLAGRL